MDLKAIRLALDSSIEDDLKERIILSIIGKDEKAIPFVMEMLSNEREDNRELKYAMNLELSRAHIYIENPDAINGKNKEEKKAFVIREIDKFYTQFRDRIHHCFNKKY